MFSLNAECGELLFWLPFVWRRLCNWKSQLIKKIAANEWFEAISNDCERGSWSVPSVAGYRCSDITLKLDRFVWEGPKLWFVGFEYPDRMRTAVDNSRREWLNLNATCTSGVDEYSYGKVTGFDGHVQRRAVALLLKVIRKWPIRRAGTGVYWIPFLLARLRVLLC